VAYVAVELAAKILGDLNDKKVLLVGAGEMAELAAKHLINQVEHPITVINRTYDNAVSLASELRGSAIPIDKLEEALVDADVAITSTGSREPLISVDTVKTVMKRRRFRPVFLIDIAIPRDVEPDVHEVDGVYLYNIDDLQLVVQENLGERHHEAIRGEAIVTEEVGKFMNWTRSLESAPIIVALLNKLEEIRNGELGRLNGKLAEMTEDQREVVEQITRSIINKIAHDPIVFLKHTGTTARSNLYLDIAQRMFKLDTPSDPTNPEKEESLEE
jgi:glutamyl-tRNA reductase